MFRSDFYILITRQSGREGWGGHEGGVQGTPPVLREPASVVRGCKGRSPLMGGFSARLSITRALPNTSEHHVTACISNPVADILLGGNALL